MIFLGKRDGESPLPIGTRPVFPFSKTKFYEYNFQYRI